MNVEIEFIGISRLLTNTSKVTLSIDEKQLTMIWLFHWRRNFPHWSGRSSRRGVSSSIHPTCLALMEKEWSNRMKWIIWFKPVTIWS